jgi:hypothetical protein
MENRCDHQQPDRLQGDGDEEHEQAGETACMSVGSATVTTYIERFGRVVVKGLGGMSTAGEPEERSTQ